MSDFVKLDILLSGDTVDTAVEATPSTVAFTAFCVVEIVSDVDANAKDGVDVGPSIDSVNIRSDVGGEVDGVNDNVEDGVCSGNGALNGFIVDGPIVVFVFIDVLKTCLSLVSSGTFVSG